MLLGDYGWGTLSDIIGRRSTMIMSLAINGVAGFLSALAPNYRGFGTLCNFIAKCVLRIVVVACTVMVVIATRCLSSHYKVSEQCRAQWMGWPNSAEH